MTAGLCILMIDDSEDDVLFVERALKKSGLAFTFRAVHDGHDAMHYLQREEPFNDASQFPMPNLLLVDIKMPQVNGFEFLRWLKKRPNCAIIPTVVFTSSAHPTDVKTAYELGANGFLMKPAKIEELSELLQATHHYWSLCVRPPVPERC